MLWAPGQKDDDGGRRWWMASKEQTDCAGEGVQGHALGQVTNYMDVERKL